MESNLENEIWIQINKDYSVSNFGNVKSHSRTVKSGRGTRVVSEKLLVTFIKKQTKYPTVGLYGKQISVHILVATAFLGKKPFDNAEVNHIDGNRQNNKVTNLEWVTPSRNQKHSYESGLRVGSSKNKFSSEHPTSKKIVAVNLKTGKKTFFDCGMDAVRIGFKSSQISRVCHGKIKSHAGHFWYFNKH